MIKAVLDTNVLISSLFWKGAPYKIFQKGLGGTFIILTSLEILEEVKNKLINKFRFPLQDTNDFIEIITINSKIIKPTTKFDIVKEDPSDNKIIECALAGEANYIVSGDKHLLDIKRYNKIKIILPKDFLKLI